MPLTRGQRLRRLRDQKGVEQKEAAAHIKVTAAWLSMLERDVKGKNVDHIRSTLERAAAYYEVLPAYLLAEHHREYIAAYVAGLPADDSRMTTANRRLKCVLAELHRRWGDEFSPERIAEALGVSGATLAGLVDGGIPLLDDAVIRRLEELTGAPATFFAPAPATTEDDPRIRRIIQQAVASGIPLDELEHVIQAWLLARRPTKPPS